MTAAPPATVLVCTRGRGQLVTECVQAILADLRGHDELIVVEAQSAGAPEFPVGLEDARLRWIEAPLPGKSRQLNLGIQRARNEVIVITDDDCLIAQGWISAMAAPFLEAEVGIAFGPTEGLSRLPGGAPEIPFPGPAPPAMWRFSHGAAMAVRRDAAIDVGGFDERLGPGASLHGEEADLMLRMRSRGWRCFVADAPPIQHVEWRTATEEVGNLLVYERGGGAWVGAALRRGSPGAAAAIITRLRYQCAHLRRPDAFALRAEIAFCSGLVSGLRLAPRRFLRASEGERGARSAPRPSVGAGRARAIERLPWPSVHGRRCLCLGHDERIADELRRRQAGEVTLLRPGKTAVEDVAAGKLGRFDLVVAQHLAELEEPIRWLQALYAVCDSHLLSIERLHLWLTLLGRRRSFVTRAGPEKRHLVMNGAAHRRLLEAGGFTVQVVGCPWVDRNGGGRRYAERAILARPANLLSYRGP